MSKSSQRLDKMIADDLGLALAPIAIVLKHATRFPDTITGFVFAYVVNDTIYYDTVKTWHWVNGMRVRNPKFGLPPIVNQRLMSRHYRRWYVMGNHQLFPLQTAKVDDLKEQFQFIVDDSFYRTTVVFLDDTMFIRKRPLLFHRQSKPNWGESNVKKTG